VVFPSSSSVPRRLSSLHGVPRVGSPASQVLSRRSDSPPPLPPRFVAFVWRYRADARLRSHGAGACGREPGLLIAGRPSSMTPRKRWGLPGSWTDPCLYAALSDPGEISMPGHNGISILPVPSLRRRLPRRRSFRGSITRLARSLSTLRGAGCPALHARLASGWWPAFAGQGSHLLGPLRKVSGAGYVIPPPFPGLPGAT
jgi:hypothetical protein